MNFLCLERLPIFLQIKVHYLILIRPVYAQTSKYLAEKVKPEIYDIQQQIFCQQSKSRDLRQQKNKSACFSAGVVDQRKKLKFLHFYMHRNLYPFFTVYNLNLLKTVSADFKPSKTTFVEVAPTLKIMKQLKIFSAIDRSLSSYDYNSSTTQIEEQIKFCRYEINAFICRTI